MKKSTKLVVPDYLADTDKIECSTCRVTGLFELYVRVGRIGMRMRFSARELVQLAESEYAKGGGDKHWRPICKAKQARLNKLVKDRAAMKRQLEKMAVP